MAQPSAESDEFTPPVATEDFMSTLAAQLGALAVRPRALAPVQAPVLLGVRATHVSVLQSLRGDAKGRVAAEPLPAPAATRATHLAESNVAAPREVPGAYVFAARRAASLAQIEVQLAQLASISSARAGSVGAKHAAPLPASRIFSLETTARQAATESQAAVSSSAEAVRTAEEAVRARQAAELAAAAVEDSSAADALARRKAAADAIRFAALASEMAARVEDVRMTSARG
jgi:hypothetical protein